MLSASSRLLRGLLGTLVQLAALGTTVSAVASASNVARPAPAAPRDSRTTVRNSRTANVLVAEATALATTSPDTLYPSAPLALGEHLAYPPLPRAASAPATFVYLHGIHGRADRGCPVFRAGTSELGWLVCPEAPVEGPVGFFSWGSDLPAQANVLRASVDAARRAGAATDLPVVIGFSQGSFLALDLLKTRLARARALVLLGADVHPSVTRLRAAGVERVVLGSGSRDAPYASLVRETARLEAEGMPARFVDLGAVGHTYATEAPAALHDAIAWAATPTSAAR